MDRALLDMIRNDRPHFVLREEDASAFGLQELPRPPDAPMRVSDYITLTPRSAEDRGSQVLRQERGRTAIREIRVDLETNINPENLRMAFEGMGSATRRVADSMRQMGRAVRNSPIQADIAAMTQRMIDAGYQFDPRRVELAEAELFIAMGQLSREPNRQSFMSRMAALAEKDRQAAQEPHPDAGKVINRPRRSVEGFMVEDVRNADGSITRRLRTKE